MDSLRRGSHLIKSLGTGHKELQLVISEQKSARVEYKTAIKNFKSAGDQLAKWSLAEECEALQYTVGCLAELNSAWCEVQRELADQLKVANTTFQKILDEEKEVDKARKALEKSQQKEKSMQKEVDRLHKKGEDPGFAERKLEQATRVREISESELQGQHQETEANKQNMVREGLLGVSQAHLTMAQKCTTLFQAYETICHAIPVRHGREADPPPFTGASTVASVCQNAIRTMGHAQVTRTCSVDDAAADKRRSGPPSDPLPSPPAYTEVDGGFSRSAPSSMRVQATRSSAARLPASPQSADDGWGSDEFDD